MQSIMSLNDKNPVEDALRNSLILNRIFVFLPTNFLLHRSSLVSKLWCEESRKFIRDYRKCTAIISHESEAKPFARNLMQFNEYFSGSKTAVPYNGIAFALNRTEENEEKQLWNCFNPSNPGACHSEEEYEKLSRILRISSSNVRLKYLTIDLEPADCLYCSKHGLSMAKVLRSTSKKIEYLNIMQGPSLLTGDVYLMSSSTVFPKLETLEWNCEPDAKLFSKIIGSAPNLQRVYVEISNDSKEMLKLFPPEKLHLLKNLQFQMAQIEDAEIYERFTDVRPALEMFFIVIPPENQLAELGPSFHRLLQQFLGFSQASLTKMAIGGKSAQILSLFQSVPSLKSTTLLELYLVQVDATGPELCSFVRGIDFDRFFPSLQKVALSHNNRLSAAAGGDEDNGQAVLIPAPVPSHSSSTVTRLELDLDSYRNISFNQLKETFPALTSFRAISLSADNVIILWQIIRLWPGLTGISLQGQTRGVWRSNDSEFCGTSREEMEYLWKQSPEFLSKFHLVPIRPCLSTLANLRILEVDVESDSAPEPLTLQPQFMFISKVTDLLVFGRLPLLETSVRLHYTGTSISAEDGTYEPKIIDFSAADWRREYLL